ncbi:hypothetical protein EJ02DRAFT_450564 [Clathrospora elynae]|uniref:BTB domain-containing protein n=1 Tax=Clathrospora elynae TaxID=706981 RepID=A0A6A5T0G7_9PLEO|nr:hypothetical protein EJ02DRAFT_450564 [Clathrospora elynae]
MLKVIVVDADNSREFYIHEALPTSSSKFFEKTMKRGWEKAEEKLFNLPEDDPETFALYRQVVYTGRIPVFHEVPEQDSDEDELYTYCNNKEFCKFEYETRSKILSGASKNSITCLEKVPSLTRRGIHASHNNPVI